jgi:hypothetical protein
VPKRTILQLCVTKKKETARLYGNIKAAEVSFLDRI